MERVYVYECRNESPDEIKYDVVPHVAFERAADDKGDRADEVCKQEHVTPKYDDAKQGESIGCKDGDGPKPSNKISEYFKHETSIVFFQEYVNLSKTGGMKKRKRAVGAKRKREGRGSAIRFWVPIFDTTFEAHLAPNVMGTIYHR